MHGLVDDIVLVDDDLARRGMDLALRHTGLVLEPAGALGLAALLAAPERFAGRRVATVLCGGNREP
jgi:threonine dehydratase